ncbi:MAG: phosphonate ABC transporter, permease protein PhnE [Neomegalonema sp.]|nr:phosphonate ABC transporter, permease protein PhnE [Neomegalonema sp.]
MQSAAAQAILPEVTRQFSRKRLFAFGSVVAVLGYLVYVFFAFDILGLNERARWDNANVLVADFWSYKTHVVRQNRTGDIKIAIEGENKGTWPEGKSPDWVERQGDRVEIDLGEGHRVFYEGKTDALYRFPGYGDILLGMEGRRVKLTTPDGQIPDWINASNTRVAITTDQGRLTFTRAKTEVFHYEPGWELFFFTLDSPFYGRSFGELVGLAFSSERVVPERSNIGAMWHDFWHNKMWHHAEVFGAIFETVLMAFLGTMTAALVALPMAFMAATNFSPFMLVRQFFRRIFDFARGVDALIWTIVLSRAFGPGPMTGALAIALTDSGSFGKMFSEALENVDNKQIDGVSSTGAHPLQRYRFGVIPQVMPVLLSQILYYLESNTRSATIIGAITGGGIGLLITQAMYTQKDWEEVCYYIILIVLMVMAMDSFSGWLRRKLIKGKESGLA